MTTKKKSKKTGSTKPGRKRDAPILEGSPITVGGGGGGGVPVKLFIEFIKDDWDIVLNQDPIKGRLILKDVNKGIKKIKIEANDVIIKVPVDDAPAIDIRYK